MILCLFLCWLGHRKQSSFTTTVPVAQWIRRVTTNHEIGGSNPSGDGEDGLVGYDDCLTRSRSRVRSSVLVSVIQEAMAQRQRVGFQTRRLGVQIPLASSFFERNTKDVRVVWFGFELNTSQQRSGAVEARWAHNPKVRGSKPLFASALLAQLAARRSHNPKVVSSILTEGICLLHWRSW